jgi:hypothetical protein
LFIEHNLSLYFLSEIIPVSTQGLQELPNDLYKIYIAQYTEVAVV